MILGFDNRPRQQSGTAVVPSSLSELFLQRRKRVPYRNTEPYQFRVNSSGTVGKTSGIRATGAEENYFVTVLRTLLSAHVPVGEHFGDTMNITSLSPVITSRASSVHSLLTVVAQNILQEVPV